MIKKITYHFLPIAFLFLISIIVYHVWFSNLSPITYGDWTIDYIETVREKFSLPFIWTAVNGIGSVNYGMVLWPLQMLIGFSAYFISNQSLIERIFVLWPVVLITPLSMYFLSYYILRSKIASMISAIVFTFNTFLIVSRSGPLLLHMAITFTPLYLLFFIKMLDSKKLRYGLIASIFGFIISFWEFRIFYITFWFLLFYFIYHLIIEKNDRTNIKLYFLAFFTVIITIILNLYALLGLQNVQVLISNEVFNQVLFGGWYLNLSKIMNLFHFGWTGKEIGWDIQPQPLIFFLVSIITLLGFVLSRKNKKIPFFAFLAVLNIFLTKMAIPPFPKVYQWLFDNLPGFNAFRESGKFAYFITLSYAVLIGSFVQIILNNSKKLIQKIASFIIILGIAFLFLWNAKPIITGEFGMLSIPRNTPEEYIVLKRFILKQPEYFRTLWVPLSSQWGIRTLSHPIVSNYQSNKEIWKEFAEKQKKDIFGINVTDQILDLSSIKYVIVPLEDKENEDNFFRFAGKRKNFIKELNKLEYLKEIKIGTEKVTIYENSDYRPHLYITYLEESITKNIPFINADYIFNNPTEYKININKNLSPFYINFSEGFHPSWKIRIGEFNWFTAIINKSYFLPDKNHFENEAKLNSFLIDPKLVCQNNLDCQSNSDGTYDIEVTLFFKPQSFVYLGLIIEIITISSIVMYSIYYLLKQNKHLDSNKKK